MMNQDGSYVTLTPREFAKRLARLPKVEQDYILAQRKLIDTKKEG